MGKDLRRGRYCYSLSTPSWWQRQADSRDSSHPISEIWGQKLVRLSCFMLKVYIEKREERGKNVKIGNKNK